MVVNQLWSICGLYGLSGGRVSAGTGPVSVRLFAATVNALNPSLMACAKVLSVLDGEPFQLAITSLVAKNHCDFQCVPPLPQGDGGLDGLVGNSIGYCCYGIQDVQQHNARTLTAMLVAKFKGDLLRVFEFDRTSKKTFVDRENTTLEGVLVNGAKLKTIYLVCNAFEQNTAIGKLRDFFQKLKAASKCRFIDATCSIVIEGPREITNRLTVPLDFQATIENAAVHKLFTAPPTTPVAQPPVSAFEEKMAALVKVFGVEKVKPIEQQLRRKWIEHLALVEKLNAELPREFQKVSEIINDIRQDAPMHFIGVPVGDAIKKMVEYRTGLEQRLIEDVPLTEAAARRAAQQIAAALVGECGIDWR